MDPNSILKTAAARLADTRQDPRRLSMLYGAVALALSTLVTVVNFLLARQLDSAGGLAGMGTRAILSTAQSVLTLATVVLLPFWDAGYRYACLRHARNEYADGSDLLEGLRRWAPVLRLNLLRALLISLLSFVCLQAAGMLFLFSPFSMEAMETLSQIPETTDPAAMEAVVETMLPLMIPLYVIFAVVLLVVLIPVFYRLRLADLRVLDGENRALRAMKDSNRAMRGHMWQYFLLDLKFWWFYLGQLLTTALAYGDTLLNALGVNVNPNVTYFVFFALSVTAQFLLTWRFAPLVNTANAVAYETLKPQKELRIEN